jgi:hypothetical protein
MNKNIIVKEPEELVLMKGDFSESALKLSAYLIASLKQDEVIYKIKVKDYLERFDKKIGNYDYLHDVAKELTKKQFEIEDRFNKTFEIYNFVASVKYKNSVLEIEFSRKLLVYLLEIKEKYLKYDIKNIMSLNSKYAIRLYKILKDKFEQESRYNKKAELTISIDDLRELLSIPKSYKFGNIKEQILEKTKQEFSESTDISFEYNGIKTGRKMTHLKFYISSKNNEKLEIIQDIKKEKLGDNWKSWRQALLKKSDLVILLKDEIFELKDNYLFKDNQILSSENSLEIWKYLYNNKNKLKIIDREEYLQIQIQKSEDTKNQYKKIDTLKEKYKYLIVKINGEHKEVSVVDIQFENNVFKLYMSILGENQTVYQPFENLEELENFLKVCNDSYLRNKNKNVSNEVDNNLVQKVKGLKDKYINKQLLIEIDENEKLEAKVLDIKINSNDIGLDLQIEEGEEIVESFELNDDEINRLEKFLKVCNEAYLKTQTNSIKNKLSSVIKKF